ncbi:MAG: hypothetical protein ACQEP5_06665, partial [Actinomycetota bacterium]
KASQAMRFQVKKIINNQSGYTIVEMLLVLMLMFLVIAAITLTYFTSANSSKLVIDTASAEMDARTAMYSVSKEIREATQITEADTGRITFTSDVNSDEIVDEVSYYLQSHQESFRLYRAVNGRESFLADNIIDNSLFSYFSSPGEELSVPVRQDALEDIGIVGISIIIDRTGAQSERTMELGTMVTLRNKL